MYRPLGISLALCLSITLSGCGSGSSETNDNRNSSQQVSATGTGINSTLNMLESIYTNRRTPDSFYSEPQPDPGIYQTISHIKNVDIMDPADLDETTPRYELCAGNFSEALNWSIASSENPGNLVDNSEHILFYQFTYASPAQPEQTSLQRVFKCDMVDRSALDIRVADDKWGQYAETVQDKDNVKILIEYLWSFSEYNNYGNAILSSNIVEHDDHFMLTMEHARLISEEQPVQPCDRVDLYLVNYRTDKFSGEITVSEAFQSTTYSTYRDGTITVCED